MVSNMKLIETKCPNCGSSLKVEKRKKNVECEYCGANFVVDDNTIEVKHFNAGEINEEQEYINADTNLNKLKNYDEAYNIYLSLSNRYVDNPATKSQYFKNAATSYIDSINLKFRISIQ